MSERDSDIREILSEGFTGNTFVYFEEWENPTTGTSQVYDFESDDGGFTVSGTGCTTPYTFDNPMRTSADCTP